jgi:pyruvate dehydrogenase kinase 2/3/4
MINQYHWIVQRELPSKLADMHSSVVEENSNVSEIIEMAVDDARAFCIEKSGDAPPVSLVIHPDKHAMPNRPPHSMLCVESHLHFIVVELLKNSMKAVMDLHASKQLSDTEDASEIPAIVLAVSSSSSHVGIKISDQGGGIKPTHIPKLFNYFFSTSPPIIPTYTYGAQFGVCFRCVVTC